jgi:CheY-like chemotaxis protein
MAASTNRHPGPTDGGLTAPAAANASNSFATQSPRRTTDPAWVLVADDDENECMLAFRLLEQDGHHATVTDTGPAALDLLAAEPYDLVLLDLALPGPDGYDLLSAIKQDQKLRHVPVIATSPVNDVGVVTRCIERGADDYVPKPFEPVLLRAKVDASLTKKRLREHLAEHLDAISNIAEATSALIGEEIDAATLDRLARRPDPIGHLARAVLQMAVNVRTTPPSSRRGSA